MKIKLYDEQAKQVNAFETWAILAGKDIHKSYYRYNPQTRQSEKGKGERWLLLRDGFRLKATCLLDVANMADLDRMTIAPKEQKHIQIFAVGELPTLADSQDDFRTRLLMNIAENCPNLTACEWIDDSLASVNVTDEIQRIRDGKSQIVNILNKISPQPKLVSGLGENPSQIELIDAFLRWLNAPLKSDEDGRIVRKYNGECWQAMTAHEVRRALTAFLKAHNQARTARKINALLELLVTEIDELGECPPALTGFKNGVLNRRTGEFTPLDEALNLRCLENFELSLSTDCPLFDDWLAFTANGDEQKEQAILAALFMTLTNRHEWGLFVEAVGKGGAGKSVMGHIASLLNGRNSTAIIDLAGMDEKETRVSILNKTMAYSPDQPAYNGTADGLKRITGGDPVEVRYLRQDSFSIIPTVCVLLVSNHPIGYRDREGAISRRRVIIYFDRAIPAEKRDVNFTANIQTEIYGITRKLLQAFPDPSTARQILENYRTKAESLAVKVAGNHLLDFAQVFGVTASLTMRVGSNSIRCNLEPHQAVYKAYLAYCEAHDIHRKAQLSLNAFKEAFISAMAELGKGKVFIAKRDGYDMMNVHLIDGVDSLKAWE